MRPTKAYIAGVGTTGLLVASSLLVLVVMSALVAFRGYPGAPAFQERIQSTLLPGDGDHARAQVPASTSAAAEQAVGVGRPASKPRGSRRSAGGRTPERAGTAPRTGTGVSGRVAPRQPAGSGPASLSGSPVDTSSAPSLPGPKAPPPSLPQVTLPPVQLPPPPQSSPLGATLDAAGTVLGGTVNGLLGG